MPVLSIPDVRLAGISAAIPPIRPISWEELGSADGAFEPERQRRETPFRRAALPEQCQSDFCVAAAERLIQDLGWSPDEIDLVVMTTLTADYPIPATAIIIQDRLGIPKTAAAFDLPSGSDGFLHGLQVVAAMLSSGGLRKGLLLSGEVSKTEGLLSSNPSYRIVPGHSGTVMALEHSPDRPAMVFDSGGDGSRFQSYHMPVGGVREPPSPEMFATPEGVRKASECIVDHQAIGQAARAEIPASILRALGTAGRSIEEIDHAFVTPLELPVEDDLRRAIGLTRDRFTGRLAPYGFSGSGSIPLAILATRSTELSRGPFRILMADTGPGLSWGSAILETDRVICPDILDF